MIREHSWAVLSVTAAIVFSFPAAAGTLDKADLVGVWKGPSLSMMRNSPRRGDHCWGTKWEFRNDQVVIVDSPDTFHNSWAMGSWTPAEDGLKLRLFHLPKNMVKGIVLDLTFHSLNRAPDRITFMPILDGITDLNTRGQTANPRFKPPLAEVWFCRE